MNLFPFKRKSQRIGTEAPHVHCDRGFIAKFRVDAAEAVAQDLVSVMAATPLTAATQTIQVDLTNPLVPRSLRVKGNQVGVTGDVVITGTNYLGVEITETIALNGNTAVEGNKAFKTVTKVDLPIEVNVGTDTVSIGVGNKLGLPYRLSNNSAVAAFRDGVREASLPSVTFSETSIEENTVQLNSALNGTEIEVMLIV